MKSTTQVNVTHQPNERRKKLSGAEAIRKSKGSLYVKVSALLKRQINLNKWVPGERIPSIESLSSEFGVAIVTIRQALALLEDEGLVERRQGRGTYVSLTVKDRKWVTLESSWQEMLKKWEGSRPKILKENDVVGSPILNDSDGVPAPAYRFLRRVHFADDNPYAVINIYIDRRLFALSPERFEKEMVILVLESLSNVEIATAKQTLTIGTADVEVAELLNIPVNAPVGEVRRVITDASNVVIYVGEATYRGDVVKLERTLSPKD